MASARTQIAWALSLTLSSIFGLPTCFPAALRARIYGNVGNMASGRHIQQTATVNVHQGDLKCLTVYLEGQGIDHKDIQELNSALKADGKHLQSMLKEQM